MGIKNFNKFLKDNMFVQQADISILKYKKIAIDASNIIYRYKIANSERWKWNILLFINFLKKNNISCIFIFDGKPLEEKNRILYERKKQKINSSIRLNNIIEEFENFKTTGNLGLELLNILKRSPFYTSELYSTLEKDSNLYIELFNYINSHINKLKNWSNRMTKKDIMDIKFLLKILGVEFDTADSDGEAMCSKLSVENQVYAVYSTDSDCLAYGTEIWIQNINWQTNSIEFVLRKQIMEFYNLNNDNFLNWLILCGTDFNKNIKNFGVNKSLNIILTDRSENDLIKILQKLHINGEELNYYTTQNIFKTFGERENAIQSSSKWNKNNSYISNKEFCQLYFSNTLNNDDNMNMFDLELFQ